MDRIVHEKPLVVLDFDQTLVEQDSSRHLAECLGGGGHSEVDQGSSSSCWKPTIEGVNSLLEAHHRKKGNHVLRDVELAMRQMTFVKGMDHLVRALSQDCDLVILSGGCDLSIESFLKSKITSLSFVLNSWKY